MRLLATEALGLPGGMCISPNQLSILAAVLNQCWPEALSLGPGPIDSLHLNYATEGNA